MNNKPYSLYASRRNERGNVLFFILIATALFGALSFVVGGMMRGGDNATSIITEERAKVYAGEILDHARSLRQAVKYLKISNDCSDTDISFENTTVGGYTNGTNTACQIFHVDGGDKNYIAPNEKWLNNQFSSEIHFNEWYFAGDNCIEQIGTANTNCHTDGIDNSELIVFMPYLKREICLAINDKLDIENPSDEPPTDPNSFWSITAGQFQGAYSETGRRIDGVTIGNDVAFCIRSTGANPAANSYTFLQVLLAR